MKQFLKLSLAILALVIFTAGAMAQSADRQKMSKEEKIQMKVDKMKTELNLSDDQAAKIKAIYLDHFNSAEKSREDHKAQRAEVHSRVKAVLTPEQATKMEAMHAERKEKMKAKHGERKKMKNKGEERGKTMQEKEVTPAE